MPYSGNRLKLSVKSSKCIVELGANLDEKNNESVSPVDSVFLYVIVSDCNNKVLCNFFVLSNIKV